MNQVFVSWSGGKDSCLSYIKAIESDLEVRCLVNIVNDDGVFECTHGLPASLIQAQAQAIGIPIIQLVTSGDKYEADLKKLCSSLKQQGIDGAVFGNGNVEHDWVERVCRDAGVTAHFPLDELGEDVVIRQLVDLGYQAITVTARADVLNEGWLGRRIDLDFLEQISELRGIMAFTPGGKAGVYHTTVLDGPIFNYRLDITSSGKELRNGFWFLNVFEVEKAPKQRLLSLTHSI
jgi:uncharacterized protein (TIGR00290 family)